ncbi:hypothetical protein C0J52_15778 [Blattella germanica]|nr:hypothetical protein C0J52_15778 [Blattella germanica]
MSILRCLVFCIIGQGFLSSLAFQSCFTRLVESFYGTYFMVKSVDGCPCNDVSQLLVLFRPVPILM